MTERQKEKSRAQEPEDVFETSSVQGGPADGYVELLATGRRLSERLNQWGIKPPSDEELEAFCAAVHKELQQNSDHEHALALFPYLSQVYIGLNQLDKAFETCICAASMKNFTVQTLRPIMPIFGKLLAHHKLTIDAVATRLEDLFASSCEHQRLCPLPRAVKQDLVRQVVAAATDLFSTASNCTVYDYAQAFSLLDTFGDTSEAAQTLKDRGYRQAPQQWQRRMTRADSRYFARLFERVGGQAPNKPIYDAFLDKAARADRQRTAFQIEGNATVAALGVLVGLLPFLYLMATGVTAVSLGAGLLMCSGFIIFPAILVTLRMAYHLYTPWGGSDL